MPSLFLVATPIGNLEDMGLRAIRTLSEVGLIAAEDTRTTGRLLKYYAIETPMVSYHDFSRPGRIAELVGTLAMKDIALVSESGMPGLSDPGYKLVQAVVEEGFDVIVIPGPSTVTTALVGSALPTDRFLFLGFLPRKKSERRRTLAEVAGLPFTLVLYEAPHRLLKLLADVEDVLGDRRISIGRELTKLYEETWRGRVGEAIGVFEQGKIRGEVTLVIEGGLKEAARWDETAVLAALAEALAKGQSRKEAAGAVAIQAGWRKREVYDLSVERREEEE